MSPDEFRRRAASVKTFVQTKLPQIVGVEAVKHFKHGFDTSQQGFTDDVLEPWVDISEKRKAQKRKKNGAMTPILTESGDLGDSLVWQQQGPNVAITTDVPYGKRHNEGTNGMPKRQFMGPSKALDRTIEAKITRELEKLFK